MHLRPDVIVVPGLGEADRGLGLIQGIELKENAGPTIKALQEHGVLVLGAGPTVVRYLPPLVITAAQIDAVTDATRAALAA